MRKTKEILRLKHELGLSNRQIARSCSISPETVGRVLRQAEKAGITWPLPAETDNPHLEELLRYCGFAIVIDYIPVTCVILPLVFRS